jgi:short-subunit dehydrogenase
MASNGRPLAIVTGASSDIGYELAQQCAGNGFDLLVAAEPAIHDAASDFRALGTGVEAVEADLGSIEGVEKLYAATRPRRIEALLAKAGRRKGFLDQDSTRSGAWSTPTSPARFTPFRKSGATCAPTGAAES